MRAVYLFDVYEIQLQLESVIYKFVTKHNSYVNINKDLKLTFHEIIRWWVLNRLDHICHVPVVNNTIPLRVPLDLMSYLLNNCSHQETQLYRTTVEFIPKNVNWVQATAEVMNGDLKIELIGSKKT